MFFTKYCRVVISDYVLAELKDVVERKFLYGLEKTNEFINDMTFELVYAPTMMNDDIPNMRDPKDEPILASAIEANVDVLLTGNKDFLSLNIERPKIMSMSDFLNEFSH